MDDKLVWGILLVGLILFSGCAQQSIQTYECPDGTIVESVSECSINENEADEPAGDMEIDGEGELGCEYNESLCGDDFDCVDNECVWKEGCKYSNPPCESNYDCTNNECILKEGCNYNNPPCSENQFCNNNICLEKECMSNNDCEENQACDLLSYICYDVPCKKDEDCNSFAKCENYQCEWLGECNSDLDCGVDQKCISNICERFVDCSEDSCEDKYFKLEDIVVEPYESGEMIKAKITAKTDLKGMFCGQWKEVDSRYVFQTGCMEYKSSMEYLNFEMSISPGGDVDYYLIQQTEEVSINYLIEN